MKNKSIIIGLVTIIVILVLYIALPHKKAIAPVQQEQNSIQQIQTQIKDNTNRSSGQQNQMKEYKNDTLGISFNYSAKCGDIKVTQEANSFEGRFTNDKDCPIISLWGVSKDYSTIADGEECGWPGQINFDTIITDSATRQVIKNDEHGSKFLIEFSLGTPDACGPSFGEAKATFNLKHKIQEMEFLGTISRDFMETLYSVKIY